MPRRGRVSELQVTRETIIAREIGRTLSVIPPWIGWLAAPVLAAILHGVWGNWLGALVVGGCCCGAAAGEWYLTRKRKTRHARLMPPATVTAAGGWLVWVTLAGLWPPRSPQVLVWFAGGGALAWHWASWLHTHGHDDSGDFAALFGAAAAKADVTGVRVIQAHAEDDGALAATLEHPGLTTEEVAKELARVESAFPGGGLPRGTLAATINPANAGRSALTAANPLRLNALQPWPGPSAPGKSIAAPVTTGAYANGRPERYTVPGSSIQVMGQTGSGKSFGWAWNEDAEQFTRCDAAVMAADITKADQTLGPMAEGLHLMCTGRDQVAFMLEGTHRAVPARTAYLAAKGYNRWVEGCGLTHLTINLEEAPDIVALLDDKDLIGDWLSDVKACRSAGIRFRISLQRSTFDQMPTIVRAQLARACYGLADDGDAEYGLSDAQVTAGCRPGDWGQKHPGRHYLDVPGIPDELIPVPARSFAWGDPADGGLSGAALMRAHCAKYPAASRPLDATTAACFELPASPSSAIPAPEAPVTYPATFPTDDAADPAAGLDDDLKHAGSAPDVEVNPDVEWQFGDDETERPPMSAADAAAVVDRHLAQLRKNGTVTFGLDLWADVLAETGKSDAWLYAQMARLEDAGQIRRRETRPRTWILGRAA